MIPDNAEWVRLKEDCGFAYAAAGSFGFYDRYKDVYYPFAQIRFIGFRHYHPDRPPFERIHFWREGREFIVKVKNLEPMSYEEAMIEIAKLSL